MSSAPTQRKPARATASQFFDSKTASNSVPVGKAASAPVSDCRPVATPQQQPLDHQSETASLQARVSGLPAPFWQHALSHLEPLTALSGVRAEWGFATRVPSVEELFQEAKARRSAAAEQQASTSRQEPSDVNGYLAALSQNRAFQSPDCVEAMASQLGISQCLEGLQGSVLTAARGAAKQQALGQLRQALKGRIRAGWSREATRRGIALAKAGDAAAALRCYQQALDLDPVNCDAYVARGAAHANQRSFQQAVADFQHALEVNPDDENAAKYLAIVTQQQQQQTSISQQPSCAIHSGSVSSAHQPAALAARPTTAGGNDRELQAADVRVAGTTGAPRAPEVVEHAMATGHGPGAGMSLDHALKIVEEHYRKRPKHRNKDKKKSKHKR